MQITLKKLVEDRLKIKMLAKKEFPVKVSYWIGRVLDKVESEYKEYENRRLELVRKLGKEQEDRPDYWKVTDENQKAFKEAIGKIEEEVVEFGNINKINIEELGPIKIEPELLVNWLFE